MFRIWRFLGGCVLSKQLFAIIITLGPIFLPTRFNYCRLDRESWLPAQLLSFSAFLCEITSKVTVKFMAKENTGVWSSQSALSPRVNYGLGSLLSFSSFTTMRPRWVSIQCTNNDSLSTIFCSNLLLLILGTSNMANSCHVNSFSSFNNFTYNMCKKNYTCLVGSYEY